MGVFGALAFPDGDIGSGKKKGWKLQKRANLYVHIYLCVSINVNVWLYGEIYVYAYVYIYRGI